jgi:uncharacterized protein YjbJ (UPF0337 family)
MNHRAAWVIAAPDQRDVFRPRIPGIRPLVQFRAEIQATVQRGSPMGANDKISNKLDDMAGKAKEGVGKATGDKDTENEGKVDQAKSSLKDAGEKVKDAFKN